MLATVTTIEPKQSLKSGHNLKVIELELVDNSPLVKETISKENSAIKAPM